MPLSTDPGGLAKGRTPTSVSPQKASRHRLTHPGILNFQYENLLALGGFLFDPPEHQ
jgi:hypothetical protein